jgi:hypothetical protein
MESVETLEVRTMYRYAKGHGNKNKYNNNDINLKPGSYISIRINNTVITYNMSYTVQNISVQ